MQNNFLFYRTALSIILILALLSGAVFLPGWANTIAAGVVFLSLSIAVYAVVQKHARLQQGKPASKIVMARNILVELTGILLAMLLAGLVGRYAAEAATRPISDESIKLVLRIFVAAGVGLGIGFVVRRAWGRLVGAAS